MSEMDAAALAILSQAASADPQDAKVIVGPVVFSEPVTIDDNLTIRSE